MVENHQLGNETTLGEVVRSRENPGVRRFEAIGW